MLQQNNDILSSTPDDISLLEMIDDAGSITATLYDNTISNVSKESFLNLSNGNVL